MRRKVKSLNTDVLYMPASSRNSSNGRLRHLYRHVLCVGRAEGFCERIA